MRTPLAAALLFLTVLLPGGPRAWSQGGELAPASEIERLALNNFLTEMADCAAYYAIAGEGLRRSGNDVGAAKHQQVVEVLHLRIFTVAKMINMKPEAALIRLKWAVEDQRKLIDDDMVNISILIDRYGVPCKSVVEDFDARLAYWISRAESDPSRTR